MKSQDYVRRNTQAWKALPKPCEVGDRVMVAERFNDTMLLLGVVQGRSPVQADDPSGKWVVTIQILGGESFIRAYAWRDIQEMKRLALTGEKVKRAGDS